ncbi:MMS19 nucleotide excision repair protein-like protein [Trichodelitschia bisporula]|uniref:MMS19 nucleotide excision repair protein n=1 Tax=Trichodelitschia bisporula TaxID=703511 RepID=A0A6G1HNH6_9PEZI|nr:MMS19 nucleotide excision repair protein-like protein [Trichodelitschia bisporula]
MSDVQLYLFEFDRNPKEAAQIAGQAAKRLETKELKLIALIESLGEYLNSDDTGIRSKTMAFVADVLSLTPPRVLSIQQRNLLCDFILSRISDDNAGIGSATKALHGLEDKGQWDQIRASTIMQVILDHTSPLSQYRQQSDRYQVLLLIDLLMAEYRDAVHDLHTSSSDFLPKFVAYFDGEKDPRNLMVVFSILKVVMTEWDISANAQELFDSAFNYFPITFRPPPDDPYGITAQDLKDRLRACIAATASFAPYAFPALLDKLDSTSLNTKRDVVHALRSCVENYGPRAVNLYSVTLWDALKFEILHAQEDDLIEGTLQVLSEISHQLAKSTSDVLITYLKPIAKECNEHLEDTPTKQSQAATQILKSIASSCPEASNFLLSTVLPHIFVLYQTSDTTAKRRGLVDTLVQLFRANVSVFGEWRSLGTSARLVDGEIPQPSAVSNGLLKYSTQTLETLTSGLAAMPVKEVSFRLTLLDALLQLTRVRELLVDDEIARVINLFNQIVLSEESYGRDEVKAAAINALLEIAHQKPQLIIDHSFPAFLGKLPDKDSEGPEKYVPVLEAFAKLGCEDKVFPTVVLRLKNKLNAAIQQNSSGTYICAILSALLFTFSRDSLKLDGHPKYCPYLEDLLIPLTKRICTDFQSDNQVDTVFYLLGRLHNVILRQQSSELQKTLSAETYRLFLGDSVTEGIPLRTDSVDSQSHRLIVTTYLLAAWRKDVPLPHDDSVVLPALTKLSSNEEISVGTKVAILQQISLIVNKFVPKSDLKRILDPILYEPLNIASGNINGSTIRIAFALFKALVLRSANEFEAIFTSLCSALSNPEHGRSVGHGFSTLLQPDEILTKENHCTISPIHRQRMFTVVVPAFNEGFRNADPAAKTNYLVALSGILRWLPYSFWEQDIQALSPLLLQTLDIAGEEDVKAGTIDTLATILAENPKAVEEHAGSLISRLLNNSSSKSNPPKVRAKALHCLSLIPTQVRRELVVPFRKQVVKRLTEALDDGKRVVRVEAVKCRSKWTNLDEAGDEDD